MSLNQSYRTVHRIYTYVEGQQEGNKMKSLFRHSEMNTLLKDCQKGLQDAFMVFKVLTVHHHVI